ncbi:unnamed protein product, partial [Ambrosiozyma monospora]
MITTGLVFRLSWTFFRSGSVNSKLVKFGKLLELIDKMVFVLVIYDRQIVDFEVEDGFLTFFKNHRDQVDFQLEEISCPLDYRAKRMISLAKFIKHLTVTTEGSYEFTQSQLRTQQQMKPGFELLPRYSSLRWITIDMPYLQNLYLVSPYLEYLRIQCEACHNINFSQLTRLNKLHIKTSNKIDSDTVNSIPDSVTELDIFFQIDEKQHADTHYPKLKTPKFLQKLKTKPNLLPSLDLTSSTHISTIIFEIHRLDKLQTKDASWQTIPPTVAQIHVDYYHLDYTQDLVDSVPFYAMDNTMFGMSIPSSIPQLELS